MCEFTAVRAGRGLGEFRQATARAPGCPTRPPCIDTAYAGLGMAPACVRGLIRLFEGPLSHTVFAAASRRCPSHFSTAWVASHSRSRLLGRQTAEYGMPTDCPDFAHAALCSDAVGAVWMLSASLTTSPRLRQLSLSNCVPTRQSARLTRSARWKASVLSFERACCSTVAARCQSGWQRVTTIWLKVVVAFNFVCICPCFGTSRTHTQPAGPVVFSPCRALYIRDGI